MKHHPHRTLQILWQGSAVVLLAALIGLSVNLLRPGGLPLVGDWSPEARLSTPETGESLAISLDEARVFFLTQGAIFLDARPEKFFVLGHVEGARNLSWEDFEARYSDVMADVSPDTLIITYCDGDSCMLSKELAFALLGKGYRHVKVLVNGWSLWKEAGLPTADGPT